MTVSHIQAAQLGGHVVAITNLLGALTSVPVILAGKRWRRGGDSGTGVPLEFATHDQHLLPANTDDSSNRC